MTIRFSRGRSTPARRAMRGVLLHSFGGLVRIRPSLPRPVVLAWSASLMNQNGPGLRPGVTPASSTGEDCACWVVLGVTSPRSRAQGLALPLLVPQVLADDHHATVATDDLALVADRLDARIDLHGPSPDLLHEVRARGASS